MLVGASGSIVFVLVGTSRHDPALVPKSEPIDKGANIDLTTKA